MTSRTCGELTSSSNALPNFNKRVPDEVIERPSAVEHGLNHTGRSDDTTRPCSSIGEDIEKAPLSELAALCADDVPAGEIRRDPKTGKVWTYSTYRSAQIAERDLLSIRNHWLSNCTVVVASELRTSEAVSVWLTPPCLASSEDTRVTNAEPEAEAEGTQNEDEILVDTSPKPSKVDTNLSDDLITRTASREKF